MSSEQASRPQGDVSTEILRKQVMVNQFVNAVGCTSEQATHILQSAQWQFEVVKECSLNTHMFTVQYKERRVAFVPVLTC